jgi:hypothetical protein
MKPRLNNKGQSVASEYVLIFFVVIAAVVAMTTMVQRALKGRVHDARNYMIDSVVNSGACDANCMAASNLNARIPYEYEPYYSQALSDVGSTKKDTSTTRPSTRRGEAIYTQYSNESTTSISTANQLPPECTGSNPPSYCANFQLPKGGG